MLLLMIAKTTPYHIVANQGFSLRIDFAILSSSPNAGPNIKFSSKRCYLQTKVSASVICTTGNWERLIWSNPNIAVIDFLH